MVRTQIYLTETEQKKLKKISKISGKKQSELIREAIDNYVENNHQNDKVKFLNSAKGLWKGRKDLPNFGIIRKEIGRIYEK